MHTQFVHFPFLKGKRDLLFIFFLFCRFHFVLCGPIYATLLPESEALARLRSAPSPSLGKEEKRENQLAKQPNRPLSVSIEVTLCVQTNATL